jgi:hypothetical protein
MTQQNKKGGLDKSNPYNQCGFDESNPYILHQFWLRDAHERKSAIEHFSDVIDG